MDSRTNKVINNYVATVAAQDARFVTAYLFGSYAKNIETSNSDIDIALIIKNLEEKDKFDMQVQLMLLAAQFDTKIEPHPLSLEEFHANNPFVAEIKKTGIEINPEVNEKAFDDFAGGNADEATNRKILGLS